MIYANGMETVAYRPDPLDQVDTAALAKIKAARTITGILGMEISSLNALSVTDALDVVGCPVEDDMADMVFTAGLVEHYLDWKQREAEQSYGGYDSTTSPYADTAADYLLEPARLPSQLMPIPGELLT